MLRFMGLQRVGHGWATELNWTELCPLLILLTTVPPPSYLKSIQFSCSVMSESLLKDALLNARPPCPSPNPGVYSNSCPWSRLYHTSIPSSVDPFSSCLQSFPASGYFQLSHLFASGGQIIGVSASTSVPSMHIQDWFPLGWIGWLSLQSKGLSRVFFNIIVQKCQFFGIIVQFSHPYMTTENTIVLTRWTFAGKEMSLLFNVLSRLIITYLPRSKHLLILWLQSPYKVIFEPPKIKSVIVSLSICHEVMGPDAMILVFWMLHFKPTF